MATGETAHQHHDGTNDAPPVDTGPAPRPFFTRFSQAVSRYAGKPVTFFLAVLVIVIWGGTGPLFGFNDTWQLIINTSTTIITFLMVFLIQNSQNRDTEALQIKIDELIARTQGPRNVLLDLEDLDEKTLDRLRADYARLADHARASDDHGAAAADDPPEKGGLSELARRRKAADTKRAPSS
ncbi:low affinity iron permease family protein [Aquabacter sp. L1I39]|uniref:low affinity iron permease family protein n=1 Tax=Aquabacter sp. L1I39 TaxID=2820278 RepID=UPI001ADB6D0E|nr:low affinity iron permease family protein [Aquabacter sp. L1I39]QTL05561.1 low affinity iron permease family protein [Aquabacter sp. L1I39]